MENPPGSCILVRVFCLLSAVTKDTDTQTIANEIQHPLAKLCYVWAGVRLCRHP